MKINRPGVIELGTLGIRIDLSNGGAGTIRSDLHEPQPDAWSPEERERWLRYDGAMHAIESLVLAHACAGVDVMDAAYIEGIETAVEACSNVS
ncbi:MAG: hypothetical protein HYT87_13090 [Nitrospirae bacterium]|nr:hypothetical protein [Nitrospirota bacterium]